MPASQVGHGVIQIHEATTNAATAESVQSTPVSSHPVSTGAAPDPVFIHETTQPIADEVK